MIARRITYSTLLTLAALLLKEITVTLGWSSPTLALGLLAVVVCVELWGTRAGFASAAVCVAYTIYSYGLVDLRRGVEVIFYLIATVGVVSYIKRKALFFDTLNGNRLGLLRAVELIRFLKQNWQSTTPRIVDTNIGLLEDMIANIATSVHGWKQFHDELEEAVRWSDGGGK